MSTQIDWPDNALEGMPILEKHDLEAKWQYSQRAATAQVHGTSQNGIHFYCQDASQRLLC